MFNKLGNMKTISWRIFKKNGFVLNACAALAILFASSASFADNVLPTGGAYTSGTGTISTAGNTMNIDQSSTYGITTWNSFSVGSENTVNINNGDGYTMARVTGNTASMINGNLNSSGTAYLINQNGVVVGSSGVVDTGGTFVASTRNVSDADFLDGGDNTFEGDSTGDVVNNGTISTTNGNAVLVARTIKNDGIIMSTTGDALLGAGNKVVLSEMNSAGQRMSVEVPVNSLNASAEEAISNTGAIEAVHAELKANGGNIYALAINNSGTIRATGISNDGGRVVLKADNDIKNDGGNILASNTGNNGSATITGKNIYLNDGVINTGTNGTLAIYAANGTPASLNWKNSEGALSITGTVEVQSDSINLNSGKKADNSRTSIDKNLKLTSSDGQYGVIVLNGFENVNLNADGNSDINTSNSVIINARNITVDENFRVSGDLVLNAASFDDDTNDFVNAAPALLDDTRLNGSLINNSPYNSDGWKTNTGTINFAGDGAINFDICCGVTLTSGLDADGNRVDLTTAQANFSYNNDTNTYRWYEAKGFDLFNTSFEGNTLNTLNITDPNKNGFINIVNNNNIIDFNTASENDTLIASYEDTTIGDVTVTARGDLTVVVDEATPLAPGAGKLTIAQGAALEGTTIGIFTSQQANNEINGTLNGVSFAEGTEFLNSASEQWEVFFQNKAESGQDPFKVYYKNAGTPFNGRPDCGSNPGQAGCENNADYAEQGKEYRVALTQDATTPVEGALAWGNSSQVRNNEFFTIKAYDYVDTNLSTAERISTFFVALPLQLVSIPLSGLSQVPGIQGVTEGLQGGINNVTR